MNAACVAKRKRFRIGVTSTGSGSGTYPGFEPSHSGEIEIRPSTSATTTTLGLSVSVSSATDREAILSIPRLGISHTEAVAGPGAISAYVEFEDLQVHVISVASAPAWRLDWSAIKFYVQGSLVYTGAAGSTSQSAAELYFTPSSILLIGGMPVLSSNCGWVYDGTPLMAPYDVTADVTGQATGGYWFEELAGEGLSESPVTLQTLVVPDFGGYGTSFNPAGIVTGVASGSITCRSKVYTRTIVTLTTSISDVGSTTVWDDAYSSTATIFGDVSHEFRRFNPDWYRQIIARFGFPETKAQATATNATITITGGLVGSPVVVDTDTAEAVLTQRYEDMLRIVGGTVDAPLEGPLSDTCYSPVTITSTQTYYKFFDNVVVVPFPPFFVATPGDGSGYQVTYSLGSAIETGAANTFIFYKHTNDRVRWWDNLGNKLFASFYPWRPPNTGGGSTMWQPVEGVGVATFDDPSTGPPTIGYWDPTYAAWMYHTAIAADLRLKTRPSLRSQGLSDQPFATVWPYSQPIKPLGICRFEVEAVEPVESLTMTSGSGPLWTGTNCTITHSSDLLVKPSASPYKVTLDLGSFTEELYQFPHLAKWIELTLTGASGEVYAVGVDGSETLLGTGGKMQLIPGAATKYAGTWAKDHSAGTAVVDTGADATGSGISAATLSNAERYSAFQLLTGRQPEKIEIRVTDPGLNNLTITYPKFYSESEFGFAPLDHQQSAFYFKQGPGIVFGQLEWFDFTTTPPTELTTPAIAPWARTRPTVFSWLKWKNVFLNGEESTLNVDGRLAELYTIIEGQDRLDSAVDTLAVIVSDENGAKYAILHNEWQVGALGLLPQRRRGDKQFEKDLTGYVCEVWDQAVEPKFYVNTARADVQGGGPIITSVDSDLSIPGWIVTRHTEAMDNDEASDFEVKVGGSSKGAALSPWCGYYMLAAGGGGQVSQDAAGSLRHVVAQIVNGNIHIAFHGNRPEEVPVFVDSGIAASRVCVRYLRQQGMLKARLFYVDSGSVKYVDTTNEGASYSVPVTIGSGTDVTAQVAGQGFFWTFRIDGAAIKMRVFNADGSAVATAPFNADLTVVASSADSTGIAASSTSVGSLFTLYLSYYASGTLTRITSTDSGLTWS